MVLTVVKIESQSFSSAEIQLNNILQLKIRGVIITKEYLWCNISNPTMRTGLDFKSAQFDQVWGEAEDWIKMRGLEM
jgi:hypothetical protein